jgi:hypothetical protein
MLCTGAQSCSSGTLLGCYCQSSFLHLDLPFMAVDVVATVFISWATWYQMDYVPHSKASCAGAAYSWHRPLGANESFFETAGRLSATVATPVNICRNFVQE